MQTDNKFFDDMARLASGAMGTVFGLREEFDAQVRQQVEKILQRFDFVTREEFDTMSAIAQDAKIEVEELQERLAKLEKQLADAKPAAKKAASKPAANKASGTGVAKKTAAKTTRKTTATGKTGKGSTTKKN